MSFTYFENQLSEYENPDEPAVIVQIFHLKTEQAIAVKGQLPRLNQPWQLP